MTRRLLASVAVLGLVLCVVVGCGDSADKKGGSAMPAQTVGTDGKAPPKIPAPTKGVD